MKKMISRRNFLKAAGVSAAALGLAACGGSSSSSTAASTATSTAASSTAAASGASGKVYYLNFKPEQDQDWQDLAAEYTKETGVPVTVVTAASGQYETTLMSEMEKSEAPTLFQVNGPVGLANWKDYCLDLSDSKLYGELTSDSFALKDGDAVTSIAYVIETYGIIYNKELLSAAGYTQDDIKGFDDLKKVADDIQARKAELDNDLAYNEDLLANWQAFCAAPGCAFCDWPGYHYRQHADSASRRGLPPQSLDDQRRAAALIRGSVPGQWPVLQQSANAFYYEKLVYLASMILRRADIEPYRVQLGELRIGITAGLNDRQLGRNPQLPFAIKVSAWATVHAPKLWRKVCRKYLKDRQ